MRTIFRYSESETVNKTIWSDLSGLRVLASEWWPPSTKGSMIIYSSSKSAVNQSLVPSRLPFGWIMYKKNIDSPTWIDRNSLSWLQLQPYRGWRRSTIRMIMLISTSEDLEYHLLILTVECISPVWPIGQLPITQYCTSYLLHQWSRQQFSVWILSGVASCFCSTSCQSTEVDNHPLLLRARELCIYLQIPS